MEKRILSLLLLICLILSLGVFSINAEETDEEEFVITEIMYKYEFLSKLGIIEPAEFAYLELSDTVKRAKLAEFAVKISSPNLEEPAFTSGIFSDVDENTENGAYITEAYNMGIMSGYGDGTFKPEKEVTVGEFLKTMIILLGADAISAAKGGYYRGYINVANQKGILPSDTNESSIVDLETAVVIMYDTLLAPVSDISSLGKSVDYTDSESLLYTNFGIYKTEGILSALYGYSLYGVSECKKNEIEISRQRYSIGEEDSYVAFFGDNTVCFFTEDSGKSFNAIYVYPQNRSRVTLQGRDVKSVGENSIKYGDKEKTIRLESDAVTVYNGTNYASFKNTSRDIFDSKNAEITFVDNNNNGRYDIALVFEYETLEVMSFGRIKNVIYFKEGQLFEGKNEIVLGTEDKGDEVPYYVYDEGEIVEARTLKEGDVVSVAKSINIYGDKTYTIHVSRGKISGTIESVSKDEATFVPNEEGAEKQTYYVSESYQYLTNESIKVGVKADYLLNHRGEIVSKTAGKTASAEVVGYLTAIKIKSDGIDEKIGFQIFGQNGKFATFEGEDKIILKTTTARNSVIEEVFKKERYSVLEEKIKDTLMFKDPLTGIAKEKWHGGLVKYKLSEDEKLKEIHISCDLSSIKGYEGNDKNNFSLDLVKTGNGSMRALRGWISPQIRLSTTKVFYVPDEIIDGYVDENGYQAGGMGIIGGTQDYYYNDFKIYDVGDKSIAEAGFMVKEYKAGNSAEVIKTVKGYDNRVITITDLTRAYDENKGEVYKLTGIRRGINYTCSIPVYDELPFETNMPSDPFKRGVTFDKLEAGDIIQCDYDAMNVIKNYRIIYRKSTDEGNYFGKGYDVNQNNYTAYDRIPHNSKDMSLIVVYGKVVSYDTTTKVAAVDCRNFEKEEGYSDEYYYIYFHFGNNITNTAIFENNSASKAGADNIQVGDDVVVCGFWNDVGDIVVMR